MRNKTLFLVSLAVAGIAVPSTAACVWEAAPSFPTGDRRGAFAVNQNGTLVAIGGRPFIGGESAPVHYLPSGGSAWLSGQPLGYAMMQPGAGVDASGRILVFGGWSFDDTGGGFFPLNIGFEYDVSTGEGDGITTMFCSRAFFAVATDSQRRFYVMGGRDRVGSVEITADCVERYDPGTGLWTTLAPLPEPRSDAAGAYDGNGHILVIGGADENGNTQATVFSYDIASNLWSTINAQPTALERQGAVLGGDGRVYVVGGFNSSSPTSAVSIYDPATGL